MSSRYPSEDEQDRRARAQQEDHELLPVAPLLDVAAHPLLGGIRRRPGGGFGPYRTLPVCARLLEGGVGSSVPRAKRTGRIPRVERGPIRLSPELELRARPAHGLLGPEASLLRPIERADRLLLGGRRIANGIASRTLSSIS